jgi:truncated hemoglobin YjbI
MPRKPSTSARAKTPGSNLYEAIGGSAACRGLSEAFYARVGRDPVLRPLFPGKTFTCAIEAFTAFLVQFSGGPDADSQSRWWLSLRESHLRFKIGQRERDAWMANMVRALHDVQIEEPLRSELLGLFERSSAYVVNHGEAPALEEGHGMGQEISRRWDAQTNLDELVTAIRRGDAKGAIVLAENPASTTCGRSVRCGVLAQMVRCGQSALVDYVRARLTEDPTLAQERYAGRTLLHEAPAAGSMSVVELLLSLGADPNAPDGGRHTPLYSVGNECGVEDGGRVVRALVKGGADVDAHDGVKRCTALHMAARRDNVEVAGALLDCGADIEARDSVGETPLRRAVNCNQIGVVTLLLARGADIHSTGSKGITPLLAARTIAMKRLLQSSAYGLRKP